MSVYSLSFGPNRDAFRMAIEAADAEDDSYWVSLHGTNLSFSAEIYDSQGNLHTFMAELRRIVRDLSGTAYLEVDNLRLNVSVTPLGQIIFRGALTSHYFDQTPMGSLTMTFEQAFDPITIEEALKQC